MATQSDKPVAGVKYRAGARGGDGTPRCERRCLLIALNDVCVCCPVAGVLCRAERAAVENLRYNGTLRILFCVYARQNQQFGLRKSL